MNSVSDSPRILQKTLAGRAQILDRSQKLSLLERQVLILTDGKRTFDQIQQMLGSQLEQVLDKLVSLDLIETAQPGSDGLDALREYESDEDEPVTGAGALACFDGASARFFRAKAVVANAAPPSRVSVVMAGETATSRGILFGKRLLLETLDYMEPREAVVLTSKIVRIDSEAALYYVFEQAVQAIKMRASAHTVHEITRRFDEALVLN